MSVEGGENDASHLSFPEFKDTDNLRPLILGTAGHIDHGKTSLIKALTGIDADRLPEEQARGMTIDLGFAHTEIAGRRIGIVDVPGHERFIRNMVAGATGVDMVLLVVAADDAVMPQTREHLEIIDLLGVPGGVIALNKSDIVDDAALQSAERDVKKLVQGTCLEAAPIVRTDAISGRGIDQLKAAIADRMNELQWPEWPPLFRLPIDRRFSLQGHGTIVTGSLLGGDVEAGDEVELSPRGKKLRVRSVESHGGKHDELGAGRRVALNLPGVKKKELERGDELAAPGYLRAADRFAVELHLLGSSPMLLEHAQAFRIHIGTSNIDGRFSLLDGRRELEPGERSPAILQTDREVCATHGQRFIVRASAHGITIGGGMILCSRPPRIDIKSPVPSWLESMAGGDARARVLAALEIDPELGGNLRGLYRETGVVPEEAETILTDLANDGNILRQPGTKNVGFWTREFVEEKKTLILRKLEAMLKAERPKTRLSRGAVLKASVGPKSEDLFAWLIGRLEAEGKVSAWPGEIGLVGYEVRLGEAEQADYDTILGAYERAGLTPEPAMRMIAKAGLGEEKGKPLLAFAADCGDLVEINADFILHRKHHERLLALLREKLSGGEGLTVSQIKLLFDVTRKYAIPLCEHLDRSGYTKREGDLRTAGKKLNEAQVNAQANATANAPVKEGAAT